MNRKLPEGGEQLTEQPAVIDITDELLDELITLGQTGYPQDVFERHQADRHPGLKAALESSIAGRLNSYMHYLNESYPERIDKEDLRLLAADVVKRAERSQKYADYLRAGALTAACMRTREDISRIREDINSILEY